MAFTASPALRPMLAVIAFLAYAAAILWMHGAHKSTWLNERVGGLVFATSYLFYDQPFGSIDSGLWNRAWKEEEIALKTGGFGRQAYKGGIPVVLYEDTPDLFLNDAAQRKIPAGGAMPTFVDGDGLGYSIFAIAALFLFGAHTVSLVLGFIIVLGLSVAAFLARFRDDRALAIPTLFLALTLMLLTPLATVQARIDVTPIGGYRFFVIAGILPTLHIIFELFDSTKISAKRLTNMLLLGLQLLLLLGAALTRLSAMYFVGAIAFAAVLSIWMRRNDPLNRRTAVMKAAILLTAGLIVHLGGRFLMPIVYENPEVLWHRAFIGLGTHPDWPFGNLSDAFDCKPDIPEGLVPRVVDRNGHCVYLVAVRKGAEPGPIYGAQYERLVREAFFRVALDYPWKVSESYLFYRPLLIWKTLSTSSLSISYRDAPVMVALAAQFAILLFVICFPAGAAGQLHRICGAFVIIGTFSLAPPIFAWSTIFTSPDLICYKYVGLVLLFAGAVRYLLPQRYFSPAIR
jgi:hypothetical protein